MVKPCALRLLTLLNRRVFPGTYTSYLYSAGVDGSNLKQLTAIQANSSYDPIVEGAINAKSVSVNLPKT